MNKPSTDVMAHIDWQRDRLPAIRWGRLLSSDRWIRLKWWCSPWVNIVPHAAPPKASVQNNPNKHGRTREKMCRREASTVSVLLTGLFPTALRIPASALKGAISRKTQRWKMLLFAGCGQELSELPPGAQDFNQNFVRNKLVSQKEKKCFPKLWS